MTDETGRATDASTDDVETSELESSGPWGWRNARAWRAGRRSSNAVELACYTNLKSLQVETVNAGPYTIIPTLQDSDVFAPSQSPTPRLALVIRIERVVGDDDSPYYVDEDWDQTNPDIHHGGTAGQELAALSSLILGVRLREGGLLRVYGGGLDEDPRGIPHAPKIPPDYPPIRPGYSLLPYHADWSLYSAPMSVVAPRIELFHLYTDLSGAEALALVRAARSYQEAVWIADVDPRQAWLRLVTAAESVAQLARDAPANERLAAAFPAIAEKVARLDDPELTEWIATRFADQGRSTAKFLDFLIRFRPPTPRRRPSADSPYRLDWSKLRKQLNKIYAYRSMDLHQGRPFPDVMCQPPGSTSRGIAYEVAWVDRNWRGDPPMNLHVFEYLVRGALLSWWRKTASQNRTAKDYS